MKMIQLSTHDTNSAPVVTALAGALPIARLPRPATIAARSGRKTMSWITRSPLHPAGIVDRNRPPPAEIDDQDGKPDRRLTRRDGQHEHREHLTDQIVQIRGESDEV